MVEEKTPHRAILLANNDYKVSAVHTMCLFVVVAFCLNRCLTFQSTAMSKSRRYMFFHLWDLNLK